MYINHRKVSYTKDTKKQPLNYVHKHTVKVALAGRHTERARSACSKQAPTCLRRRTVSKVQSAHYASVAGYAIGKRPAALAVGASEYHTYYN